MMTEFEIVQKFSKKIKKEPNFVIGLERLQYKNFV